MSKLLIEEPPLQVLPSLAIAIGLNEAIVLQQLHYLLRDPRFGKKVAEKQWIFNTVEQWRCQYFPFWSDRTIKTVFSNLKKLGLIETCQPEGRVSRRQYYRINTEKMAEFPDGAKFVSSMGQESSLPSTKTSSKTTLSKVSAAKAADDGVEHEAVWKPKSGTKEEQLARIKPPDNYPSEEEFDEYLFGNSLDEIPSKRSDLYCELCANKWHNWNKRKWYPIMDWRKYVTALNEKMARATEGGF